MSKLRVLVYHLLGYLGDGLAKMRLEQDKKETVNALSLGIAPDVVMKWTGHSSLKAMKPYMALADKIKKESMKKFDEV